MTLNHTELQSEGQDSGKRECKRARGLIELKVNGNVEKSRQRRSRHCAVLTYSMYAPRVKRAVALLDGLF